MGLLISYARLGGGKELKKKKKDDGRTSKTEKKKGKSKRQTGRGKHYINLPVEVKRLLKVHIQQNKQ